MTPVHLWSCETWHTCIAVGNTIIFGFIENIEPSSCYSAVESFYCCDASVIARILKINIGTGAIVMAFRAVDNDRRPRFSNPP